MTHGGVDKTLLKRFDFAKWYIFHLHLASLIIFNYRLAHEEKHTLYGWG